jgi:hypothetical protein
MGHTFHHAGAAVADDAETRLVRFERAALLDPADRRP